MKAILKGPGTGKKGFTLIEMLMAMLIMTVGLLGLLQSVNVAYEHNARNIVREAAVLLAEEQMIGLRKRRFQNLTVSNAVSTEARVIGGVNKNFTVTRDCQPMGTQSRRLRVAVTWSFKNLSTLHEICTIKNM